MTDYTKFDPANPPPPLMTGEPGSFAHFTMTTRFPAILQNVLADHVGQYPNSIVATLQSLYDELTQDQPVRPLETTAPDGSDWSEAWQPYRGRTWLNLPWYFAEAFIYRRLLEAAGYFGGGETGQGGRGAEAQGREGISGLRSPVSGLSSGDDSEAKKWIGVDPFLPRKQVELESETTWAVAAAALSHAPDGSAESLAALLHHCLWGNRADLSYTKVAELAGGKIVVASEQANLLVDDTEAVLEYLQGSRGAGEQGSGGQRSALSLPNGSAVGGRIDFICDNAGTELLLDLVLVDFLLRFGWAERITMHVKAHPTFVSDAIPADIELTLAALKSRGVPEFLALADRLEGFAEQQRWRIQSDLFWNSSRFFWEIPPHLQAELAQTRLVILKGDANYRRLLGDSRWPAAVPLADAVPYFPAPFVCLRTMKSDPIVGLRPGQAEELDREDAAWRVNGKRGLIQFLKHESNS
jgi:hypothetical protein